MDSKLTCMDLKRTLICMSLLLITLNQPITMAEEKHRSTSLSSTPTVNTYVDTARRIAEKWVLDGKGLDTHGPIQTLTLYNYLNITTGGPQEYKVQLSETERVFSTLTLLTNYTGDSIYLQTATNAVTGHFTYTMDESGLIPMGDGSYWNASTDILDTSRYSGFTENEILVTDMWDLAPLHIRTNLTRWLDAIYTYHTREDGSFIQAVRVSDKMGGGGFWDLKFCIAMYLLCQGWSLTGDSKYLARAEAMANYLEETHMAATGIIHRGDGIFQDYSYGYARGLGNCWRITRSEVILRVLKKHVDGLINYAFDKISPHSWTGDFNATTGEPYGPYPGMPVFCQMYQDIGVLALYEATGDSKYLDVANQNVMNYADTKFSFPAHNQPAVIERLVDLYKLTGDNIFLDKGKQQGDWLVDFAVAHDFWLPSHDHVPGTVNMDNSFHAAKSLLDVCEICLCTHVSIYTDKYTYHAGDTMRLGLNVTNPGSVKYVCFAIWVERPDSSIYLYMHKHSIILPIGLNCTNPSFRTFTLPSLPSGIYTWHVAFLERATHTTMTEDTAEWEFA